jgi:hypothetical protein
MVNCAYVDVTGKFDHIFQGNSEVFDLAHSKPNIIRLGFNNSFFQKFKLSFPYRLY